jgi:hypothetical protein
VVVVVVVVDAVSIVVVDSVGTAAPAVVPVSVAVVVEWVAVVVGSDGSVGDVAPGPLQAVTTTSPATHSGGWIRALSSLARSRRIHMDGKGTCRGRHCQAPFCVGAVVLRMLSGRQGSRKIGLVSS